MTRQLALFFAWARLSRATGLVLGRMEGIGCVGQLWWGVFLISVGNGCLVLVPVLVLDHLEGIGQCDGQLWWVVVWVAVECFDGRLALWQSDSQLSCEAMV